MIHTVWDTSLFPIQKGQNEHMPPQLLKIHDTLYSPQRRGLWGDRDVSALAGFSPILALASLSLSAQWTPRTGEGKPRCGGGDSSLSQGQHAVQHIIVPTGFAQSVSSAKFT